MTTDQYAEKLRAFNSTEKYKKELEFLSMLVENDCKAVLDYGAGIGTAAKYIESTTDNTVIPYEPAGYCEYRNASDKLWRSSYQCVYFMHSLAHIKDVESVLTDVRDNLLDVDGKVVVITPNESFLKKKQRENYLYMGTADPYKPDPTVINHFTIFDLIVLFVNAGFYIHTSGKFGEEQIEEEPERLFLVASK